MRRPETSKLIQNATHASERGLKGSQSICQSVSQSVSRTSNRRQSRRREAEQASKASRESRVEWVIASYYGRAGTRHSFFAAALVRFVSSDLRLYQTPSASFDRDHYCKSIAKLLKQ